MKKSLVQSVIFISGIFVSKVALAGACYVSVSSPEGVPVSNAVIQGLKSDGTQTESFTTNINGKVAIRWGDNQPLEFIYVDGLQKNGCDHASGVMLVK